MSRGLLFALLLLVAAPALGHERGERGQAHEHDRPRHGPMRIPEGVVVPSWSELTEQQRKYLARYESGWDQLPASRRVLALERAERRARWDAMSPEQREKIRQGMRHYRELAPEQREKLGQAMRVVRGLPEAERSALMQRWRAMDPEQRRAWLDAGGPGISPPPGDAD